MKITRNHVAKDAGVSATTVSFILNGKTEAYNPRTIEAVRKSAKKLGYTPNKIAKALKTGKSNIITLWIYDIANIKCAMLVQNICKVFGEKKLDVIIKDTKYMTDFSEETLSDGIISINSDNYAEIYANNTFYAVPIIKVANNKNSSIETDLEKLKKNEDFYDLAKSIYDKLSLIFNKK